MGTILVILGIALVLSFLLALSLGPWGVLAAAVITGLAGTWAVYLLSGFGSPNGYGRTPHLPELLLYFVQWFFAGLMVYYALYLIKTLIMKQPIGGLLTTVWAACVVILLTAYVGYRVYLNVNETYIYVTLGFDDELDYDYTGISFSLRNGRRDESVSFHSRGYSREKNRFGYRKDTSGSATIYFKPRELYISLRGYEAVIYPVSSPFKDVTMYLNKNHVLKLYIDDKHVETFQLSRRVSQ
ncbi:MAG: hypothetical protein OEZ39_07800 [Gammaproteobacteria bacterium]|nr:hypothetical protein [Gammaproteobacteria bacterium]MDH5651763.1 hypothetical protein [Gammaproteobacteria bacterium]